MTMPTFDFSGFANIGNVISDTLNSVVQSLTFSVQEIGIVPVAAFFGVMFLILIVVVVKK